MIRFTVYRITSSGTTAQETCDTYDDACAWIADARGDDDIRDGRVEYSIHATEEDD